GYVAAYRQVTRRNHPRAARTGASGEKAKPIHAAGGLYRRPARAVLPQGLFQAMKGIADTGLLVGFANRRDQHPQWAVSVAKQVSEPLLTCEAVLAEA